jgi:hypothetical protein
MCHILAIATISERLRQTKREPANLRLDLVEPGFHTLKPAFHPEDAERHQQEGKEIKDAGHEDDKGKPPGHPVWKRERQGHRHPL